ncbi:MAG TPA: CbiQ family ECF transporter T component [Candidatus Limnocylindrales bacterium]|nr:CbiQ family ECF transporter T component [Candidatus Limnocylindrales bacterium]
MHPLAGPRIRLLQRTSPLVTLAVLSAWSVAVVLTLDPRRALLASGMAVLAALLAGGVPPHRLAGLAAPLLLAAAAVGLFNALFAAANADPAARELWRLGLLRLTEPGVTAGLALASRVAALALLGATFALTTTATRLADALVQQLRLSPRFAYGALAAYGAAPHLAADLVTLRQARRIRGLRADRHPRVLLALLVLALRRAERLATAMDARGLGSGSRTTFRPVTLGWPDLVWGSIGLAGLLALRAVA